MLTSDLKALHRQQTDFDFVPFCKKTVSLLTNTEDNADVQFSIKQMSDEAVLSWKKVNGSVKVCDFFSYIFSGSLLEELILLYKY